MNRALCLAAAAVLVISPIAANAQPAAPDLESQMGCAVVFAFVASQQDAKVPSFAHYPALDKPGEAFFNKTAERLKAERGIGEDKVIEYLMANGAKKLAEAADSKDPIAGLDKAVADCLPMFSQVAPEADPAK